MREAISRSWAFTADSLLERPQIRGGAGWARQGELERPFSVVFVPLVERQVCEGEFLRSYDRVYGQTEQQHAKRVALLRPALRFGKY